MSCDLEVRIRHRKLIFRLILVPPEDILVTQVTGHGVLVESCDYDPIREGEPESPAVVVTRGAVGKRDILAILADLPAVERAVIVAVRECNIFTGMYLEPRIRIIFRCATGHCCIARKVVAGHEKTARICIPLAVPFADAVYERDIPGDRTRPNTLSV